MSPRFSRPERLEITADIFNQLAENEDDFASAVRKHGVWLFRQGGCEPILGKSRLHDAWDAFRHDKEDAQSRPPEKGWPNHFQQAGILAYWLCRFAPVYDSRDLSMPPGSETLAELIKNYPSDLLAFSMGLAICHFFESHQNAPSVVPKVEENQYDYYKAICYVMKFKNLSPHAMGMIYRSLFVPLAPTPAA